MVVSISCFKYMFCFFFTYFKHITNVDNKTMDVLESDNVQTHYTVTMDRENSVKGL